MRIFRFAHRGAACRARVIENGRSMLRPYAVVIAMLLVTTVFAEDTVLTKAFVIKFRKVDEVASIVNTLLSDKGAVTMQPRLQTIVVQDYEKNLRQIEMAITAFDVPPPAVEISVKLVRASKNPEV